MSNFLDSVPRLLRVEGKNFGGGIMFWKDKGKWNYEAPPYLRAILKGCPVGDIPDKLKKAGMTFYWIKNGISETRGEVTEV